MMVRRLCKGAFTCFRKEVRRRAAWEERWFPICHKEVQKKIVRYIVSCQVLCIALPTRQTFQYGHGEPRQTNLPRP